MKVRRKLILSLFRVTRPTVWKTRRLKFFFGRFSNFFFFFFLNFIFSRIYLLKCTTKNSCLALEASNKHLPENKTMLNSFKHCFCIFDWSHRYLLLLLLLYSAIGEKPIHFLGSLPPKSVKTWLPVNVLLIHVIAGRNCHLFIS